MAIMNATKQAVTGGAQQQQPESLTPLYGQSPGAEKIDAPQKADASVANTMNAEATGYTAERGEVPETETASGRMTSITGQDSPLMQRARQEGILQASRRGLQNTSIAAGTAMGSMVDRATPLAQQDATLLANQRLANQEAANRATELSTGRETDVSVANVAQASETARQAAALETDVGKFNIATQQEAAIANQRAENEMRMQVMQSNADLNKQYLAGQQAMDLQTIQGQYNQLISTNETAARLYDSYFNSISQTLANKDITPARAAQYVQVQQSMLEAGLRMMDQMNMLNLDTELPGVNVTGGVMSPGAPPPPEPAPETAPAPAPAPAPAAGVGGLGEQDGWVFG